MYIRSIGHNALRKQTTNKNQKPRFPPVLYFSGIDSRKFTEWNSTFYFIFYICSKIPTSFFKLIR